MKGYLYWLYGRGNNSSFWYCMYLLHLLCAIVILLILFVFYIFSVIITYGFTLVVPLVLTYWYYIKYGMDDE